MGFFLVKRFSIIDCRRHDAVQLDKDPTSAESFSALAKLPGVVVLSALVTQDGNIRYTTSARRA